MKTKMLTVLLLCAVGGAAVAFHLRLERLGARQDNILSLVYEIDAGGATDHELTALAERVDGLSARADRFEKFAENPPESRLAQRHQALLQQYHYWLLLLLPPAVYGYMEMVYTVVSAAADIVRRRKKSSVATAEVVTADVV